MRKIIAIIIIVIGVVFVINRLNVQKQKEPQYQTATAEKTTLVVSLSASGQVSTSNSSSLATNVSGVVKNVFVRNGQQILAGQKVAEIDLDTDSKQKYMAASASYQGAKNSLETAKNNLYTLQATEFAANQKFINDAVARNLATNDPTYIQENATWLAAEANYNNQQNVINQSQTALSAAYLSLITSSPIIYAPISGEIFGLSLQKGEVLTLSTTTPQKIATIKTKAKPTISVNLTEIDVPKVKIGNKVTVTFDALADKTYTGEIIAIDISGSVSSGVVNYPAIIELDTDVDNLLPNMSAQANILAQTKNNVIAVPTVAVKSQNGQSYVTILKDGKAQDIDVETGISSTTQTEIISGINEGDMVVTSIITANSALQNTTTSPFGSTRNFGGGAAGGVGNFVHQGQGGR